ncbi:MAG: NAD(P)/FAD-dependent oxidoreductase, partial [Bacteroidia bacterium]|nr:NAD(P)/FAD-dependent oxidoreductase [Bacteroidia bacterium]
KLKYQIVLVDENNYHQFQPLFYQVAMCGLEPSSVVFPLRRVFQNYKNVYIRICKVKSVDIDKKVLQTSLGIMNYDMLVMATGATTNFFGNQELATKVIPMKSINEALYLRNAILEDFEKALSTVDHDPRQGLIDIVIVGGGPTGVEVAGALAEMKKYVLPKEYSELNIDEVEIHLIQGGKRLLPGMKETSSITAKKYLEDLGVNVELGVRVQGYDGTIVQLNDGRKIRSDKVIWAAGITGRLFAGFPDASIIRGRRLIVDDYHSVKGCSDVYAIGDISAMISDENPRGHAQVAPVAMQQAESLGKNFIRLSRKKDPMPFVYKNKGSMATIGRNKAVADLPKVSFKGFFAWIIWLIVHLMSLIGARNKVFVFINWVSNYITYDQSLRLIIKPKRRGETLLNEELVAPKKAK